MITNQEQQKKYELDLIRSKLGFIQDRINRKLILDENQERADFPDVLIGSETGEKIFVEICDITNENIAVYKSQANVIGELENFLNTKIYQMKIQSSLLLHVEFAMDYEKIKVKDRHAEIGLVEDYLLFTFLNAYPDIEIDQDFSDLLGNQKIFKKISVRFIKTEKVPRAYVLRNFDVIQYGENFKRDLLIDRVQAKDLRFASYKEHGQIHVVVFRIWDHELDCEEINKYAQNVFDEYGKHIDHLFVFGYWRQDMDLYYKHLG